jgi:hypothetical protein
VLELLVTALEDLAPAGETLDAALLETEWLSDVLKDIPTVPDHLAPGGSQAR